MKDADGEERERESDEKVVIVRKSAFSSNETRALSIASDCHQLETSATCFFLKP